MGSGPFDPRFAAAIRETKHSRLTPDERAELAALGPGSGDPVQDARFIALCDIAETFERDTSPQPHVSADTAIHEAVWTEASALRASGALLDAMREIRCGVVAIHGDHDPRPAEGVASPLAAALPDATFTLLARCGHKPWQEVHARDIFYKLLEQVIISGR